MIEVKVPEIQERYGNTVMANTGLFEGLRRKSNELTSTDPDIFIFNIKTQEYDRVCRTQFVRRKKGIPNVKVSSTNKPGIGVEVKATGNIKDWGSIFYK
jgi:hypothetical protein